MGSNGAWVVKSHEGERQVYIRKQLDTPRNKKQADYRNSQTGGEPK